MILESLRERVVSLRKEMPIAILRNDEHSAAGRESSRRADCSRNVLATCARAVASDVIELISRYEDSLDRLEIRVAANNPRDYVG